MIHGCGLQRAQAVVHQLLLSALDAVRKRIGQWVDHREADALSQEILPRVYEAIGKHSDSDLSALSASMNPDRIQSVEAESIPAFFTVRNSDPVYDFALQMGPSVLVLSKMRTSLEDLLNTLPIMQAILADLNQHGSITSAFLSGAFNWGFTFQYHIALTGRYTNNFEVPSNPEVMKKLIRLESGSDSPFGSLQPERVNRIDVKASFKKTLRERPRGIWFNVQAPWNHYQRDIDLRFELHSDGDDGIDLAELDAPELWEEAFEDFLVETALNRFLADLMHDIKFTHRLS